MTSKKVVFVDPVGFKYNLLLPTYKNYKMRSSESLVEFEYHTLPSTCDHLPIN